MQQKVTIVVPAFNAEDTLDDALNSVFRQTKGNWNAVIVDDGSSDNTSGVAQRWVERDPRFKLVQQKNQGASAARNTGLRETTSDWVVFLDADDWIAEDFLSKMLKPTRNGDVDCVFCGALDVKPDGEYGKHWTPPKRDEFFPSTAQDCPIAVHAALIRRSLVEEVGAWDTSLSTCEDWDLWQRLARSKARFANIRQDVAFIRVVRGSLSRSKAERLGKDGLVVIERGHSNDPRVPDPDPKWANGMHAELLDECLAGHIAWAAGIDIASGGDGLSMLDMVSKRAWNLVDPYNLAMILQDAIFHMAVYTTDEWLQAQQRVAVFLQVLEQQTTTHKLAQRTMQYLEPEFLQDAEIEEPLQLGATYAVPVDVADRIEDIVLPETAQRLVALVSLDDQRIGSITLRTTTGIVTARALKAAIRNNLGGKLTWLHLKAGGWRNAASLRGLARVALRRNSLGFVASLPQFGRTTQREKLRAFGISNGPELARIWPSLFDETGNTAEPDTDGEEDVSNLSETQGGAHAASEPIEEDSDYEDKAYWESIFSVENPWDYTNAYEQTKYDQTLALLPNRRIGRALELACAEGHFSGQLAPKVDELVATDISEAALARAAEACAEHGNISFQKLDLREDPVPGTFDLIVCSEVLYYVERRKELKRIAQKILSHLEPGGLLLMAHGKVAVNQPEQSGFDWGHPFDAISIREVFSEIEGFELKHLAQSELYEVHLFERVVAATPATPPEVSTLAMADRVSYHVSSQVQWHGAASHMSTEITDYLPILAYHRVAPQGGIRELEGYRVSPQGFDDQMRYLAENGYRVISVEDWLAAKSAWRGISGRAVAITFDDGYQDFHEFAWPILQKYGFQSTVFVVPDYVGKSAEWDAGFGAPAPLMDWNMIREVSRSGVTIGSHTLSHPYLTLLETKEIERQGRESKLIIEQELGDEIYSIAYPFGDMDDSVAQIMADCGYSAGLTCIEGPSRIGDKPLQLARVEISETSDIAHFGQMLGTTTPVTRLRRARFAGQDRLRRFKRDYL